MSKPITLTESSALNASDCAAAEGALNLTAQWQNSVLDFEASSTLTLEPLRDSFRKNSPLEDFKFASRPQLEASGQVIHASSPFNITLPDQRRSVSFPFAESTSMPFHRLRRNQWKDLLARHQAPCRRWRNRCQPAFCAG